MLGIKLLLITSAFAILLASSAYADAGCGGCSGIDSYVEQVLWANEKLETAKSALLDKDPADWSRTDLESYLTFALAAVYFSYQIELVSSDHMHPMAESFSNSQYLSELPENPFNNWQPMVIRDNPDAYYPGDIVRQICPAEAGTSDGLPISYELYILGPNEDWATLPVKVVTGNEQWAVIPDGAFMSLGVWVEPRQQMEERLAWIRSQLEESEQAEEDQN